HEQRDEFRGRARPRRLELVHDQQAVVVVAASDEDVRAGVLRGGQLRGQIRDGLWVGLIVDDRHLLGLRVTDRGLGGEGGERIARIQGGDLVGRVVRLQPVHRTFQVDRRGAQDFYEISPRGLRPNRVRGTAVGEHDTVIRVRERCRRGREAAAVRGQEELGPVPLNDIRVQRPDVCTVAQVVVVVEADVVQLSSDGNSTMAVDPIRGRLDAVQRVRPFDIEVARQRNGEAHFDRAGEARRLNQVVDGGGRDCYEYDDERDADRDEFSPTARRCGRRHLRFTWLRHPFQDRKSVV